MKKAEYSDTLSENAESIHQGFQKKSNFKIGNLSISKNSLIIFIVFAIILVSLITCYSIGILDKNDLRTFFDKNHVANAEDIKKLEIGMTFEEVVDILGKPKEIVGNYIIMEWSLSDKSKLLAWFTGDRSQIESYDYNGKTIYYQPNGAWLLEKFEVRK